MGAEVWEHRIIRPDLLKAEDKEQSTTNDRELLRSSYAPEYSPAYRRRGANNMDGFPDPEDIRTC